jgi:hypothetical protein
VSESGVLFTCEPVTTGGSLDNIDKLKKNEIQLALVIGNIANSLLQDTDFAKNLIVVRRIGGESLFAFGRSKKVEAVKSWIGIRENAFMLKIGLPGETSGDTATFRTLQAVEGSPLKDATTMIYKDRATLIEAVKKGEVDF